MHMIARKTRFERARFTKVFLPVLELHGEPVVRPEPVHVLERVVRATAAGVE